MRMVIGQLRVKGVGSEGSVGGVSKSAYHRAKKRYTQKVVEYQKSKDGTEKDKSPASLETALWLMVSSSGLCILRWRSLTGSKDVSSQRVLFIPLLG